MWEKRHVMLIHTVEEKGEDKKLPTTSEICRLVHITVNDDLKLIVQICNSGDNK